MSVIPAGLPITRSILLKAVSLAAQSCVKGAAQERAMFLLLTNDSVRIRSERREYTRGAPVMVFVLSKDDETVEVGNQSWHSFVQRLERVGFEMLAHTEEGSVELAWTGRVPEVEVKPRGKR